MKNLYMVIPDTKYAFQMQRVLYCIHVSVMKVIISSPSGTWEEANPVKALSGL